MLEPLERTTGAPWWPFMMLVLAACGSDSALQPPKVTAQVSLAPGAFVVLADTQVSGAVEFPAAGGAGAEYLVVGQLASPTESSVDVTLGARVAAPAPFGTPDQSVPFALRFHDLLRRREAEMATAGRFYRSPFPVPRSPAAPPVVGSKRTFKVCASVTCDKTINVPATAQFVGAHAAIFLDDSAPAGGFSAADFTQVGTQFDQVLYPIDHARFGAESDIDGNGVVIVLLSKQINALAPEPGCNSSFITGFFFGGDIAPGFATQFNNGEIFYGLVPDPSGSVSCVYTTNFVKRILPITFIHEFQHMISFNQHVLVRGGDQEVLWLNEGMSHLAEELGGLHYDSAGVDSTASHFFLGDLFNASSWMQNPENTAMVTETPPGTLAERGAEWLFLRYVLDQFGAGLSSALEQTSLTGATNLESATGTPFATLLGRWALAVYLSDLPGFTAPPALAYTSWHFRATFAQRHAQDAANFPFIFPLRPDSGQGNNPFVSGTLGAGSGAYLLSTQPAAGAGFQLLFKGNSIRRFGPATIEVLGAMAPGSHPQLAIARIH